MEFLLGTGSSKNAPMKPLGIRTLSRGFGKVLGAFQRVRSCLNGFRLPIVPYEGIYRSRATQESAAAD